MKFLHVAPDPTLQTVLKGYRDINYVSADLESPLAGVKMDITCVPYPDETFDAVLCVHVLEHVGDDRRAIGELFRTLKPGGWAILQTPIDTDRAHTLEDPRVTAPEERMRLFGQKDHVRIYGRDYVDRLMAAGFQVELCKLTEDLDAQALVVYGLTPGEEVCVCKKPVQTPRRHK